MTIHSLEKILLVEDDTDIRMIGQITLTSAGFTVVEAEDGLAALEKIKSDRPQLILMDVMMPKMDGPSTYMKIKEIPECHTIPLIFMTAKAQPQEIQRYLDMGAITTITKPYDPMELPNQILSAWKKYHELG